MMEDNMDYIEKDPLPETCLNCTDRLACWTRGEGEWCCEECETLQDRFYTLLQPGPSPNAVPPSEEKVPEEICS